MEKQRIPETGEQWAPRQDVNVVTFSDHLKLSVARAHAADMVTVQADVGSREAAVDLENIQRGVSFFF